MTEPLIRVVDFETTSLGDDAAVCEIGWTDLWHDDGGHWCPMQPHAELVNPGCFIAPDASAVHHITDGMVKDCRPADVALRELARADVDMWAAHVANFDRRFFNPEGSQWIDTYKIAVRLWPSAPNHKNMTLRYFLGLPIDLSGLPHRARLDSFVTAHVLARVLNRRELNVDQCVQISSVPALLSVCSLRKHRGKPWSVVAQQDPGYLEWYLTKAEDRNEDTEFTCRHWLAKVTDAREERAPPPIHAGDYLVNREANR